MKITYWCGVYGGEITGWVVMLWNNETILTRFDGEASFWYTERCFRDIKDDK